MILLCQTISCRPRPDDKVDTKSVSNEDKSESPELVGGNLDLLISDIYDRIIRERLQNLLQGVSHPIGEELLESSEPKDTSEDIVEKEQESLVEISLPISVTEIPREIFTSLPGTL